MRNPDATPAIVKALCQGLGVEDIAARGIAPVEHSRDVIARLRRLGLLVRVYAKSAKDNENLLGIHPKGCINESGPHGATNTDTALDITAYEGGRTMPVEAIIPIPSVPTIENILASGVAE